MPTPWLPAYLKSDEKLPSDNVRCGLCGIVWERDLAQPFLCKYSKIADVCGASDEQWQAYGKQHGMPDGAVQRWSPIDPDAHPPPPFPPETPPDVKAS